MVITFLEGRVAPEKEGNLRKAYDEAVKNRYEGILQTYMTRSIMDTNVWRIFSVWKNREAFEKVRQASEPIKGVLIFRAAGVEPLMGLFEVVDQA